MTIRAGEILTSHRRAFLGLPIYDYEFKPIGKGSEMLTTFPAAPDLVSISAAATPTASGVIKTHTIAAQPEFPRDLQVRLVDGSSNSTTVRVTIAGTDFHDAPIVEVVKFNVAGSQTKLTNKCFKTITSIKSKYDSATTTSVTIGVGLGTGFALPADIYAVADVKQLIINVDDTDDTQTSDSINTTTISVANQKYTPTSAPNGTTRKFYCTLKSSILDHA